MSKLLNLEEIIFQHPILVELIENLDNDELYARFYFSNENWQELTLGVRADFNRFKALFETHGLTILEGISHS